MQFLKIVKRLGYEMYYPVHQLLSLKYLGQNTWLLRFADNKEYIVRSLELYDIIHRNEPSGNVLVLEEVK